MTIRCSCMGKCN